MADNKNKVGQLHDLMPGHLNTQNNENWRGLLAAIGEQDQATADLIEEVRKQFFVKTASRPYIDRLAANQKIARPKLVGMDDSSFRDYIPVLSYTPKQVKLIMDKLLDIFFFKESTTAFVTSQAFTPFSLMNGWELQYSVDELNGELITFDAAEFTDITNATADEVVAAINRQAKYSYATKYYDSITKNSYIRLFTNTVGSKGSLRMTGGRANVGLRFNGFIDTAGNGSNTEWTVTKIGDIVKFQHTAGTAPGLNQVQEGDVVVIDMSGNAGSFGILSVDLIDNSIQFRNLFGTAGVFTQTSDKQVKFIRPDKHVAYTNPRRAMTWETSPGEIVIEMPTSPPVVKRSLKGSIHVNGAVTKMTNRNSDSSITVEDASSFPLSGSFWLERVDEIKERLLTPTENTLFSKVHNNRLTYKLEKYEYTSRAVLTTTGSITAGIAQITGLASTVGLSIGQTVMMQGVPPYAKITNVSGSMVDISVAATETVSNGAVVFAGNDLNGITPNIPCLSVLNEFTLTSLSRTNGVVTAVTSATHGYLVGECVAISGSSGIVSLSTTGTTTNGSNQLTSLASVAGVAPGMLVIGTGIPTGTYVVEVIGSVVTMSADATASGTIAVTFNEDLNGSFVLTSASGNTFTYEILGLNGTASTAGSSRVERVGLANSGSKVILTDAVQSNVSRIKGAYLWDKTAPFVLSSQKATTLDNVQAGKIIRLLNVGANDLPAEGGSLVFDYGLTNQEGPIRYLYKPTATTVALDPSYVFQKTHLAGSTIVAIRHKGPHAMSGRANEYAPYITDPSEARVILEDLIKSVKSAGIFVNFLVRYPEQLYATIDVYKSGVDPG